MGVISIIFDSIVTNIFSALWVVGWIFYINHTTGIYSNLSELTRDVYVCNKTINTHINTKETETDEQDEDEDTEDRLKKLEEDLEHVSHKLSKVKKLYVALSENLANLNDRVIDIEDELDENYEDGDEEDDDEDEQDSSSEDARLLEKKHSHKSKNNDKNKID